MIFNFFVKLFLSHLCIHSLNKYILSTCVVSKIFPRHWGDSRKQNKTIIPAFIECTF